ncbi:hypothetical protein HHK36_007947 [Tetracentron sinense]|uniref:Uncharacterized protein n=1 Tax=Tetracentron sinense TaxID=13715 RepID=A0A834ZEQ2_TETSI|nr:hypothetical protein HHK36_007947 [Tetracentron sinense]
MHRFISYEIGDNTWMKLKIDYMLKPGFIQSSLEHISNQSGCNIGRMNRENGRTSRAMYNGDPQTVSARSSGIISV